MEESAFPRGKRRSSSFSKSDEKKKKKKQRVKKQSVDFLFGQHEEQQESFAPDFSRKETSATTSIKSVSMMPLGGGCVVPSSKKKQAVIESISFSKLARGTKLLAMVKQVLDDYAVLSLPNMLSGYVLKEKQPLTQVLRINQILAVTVVKTATEHVKDETRRELKTFARKRIQVSVSPSQINSMNPTYGIVRGQVLSVEDHGCLMDLGHGSRGFLKFGDIHQEYTIPEDESKHKDKIWLNPGRILDVMVKDGDDTKIVPLTLPSHETMASYTAPSKPGTGIDLSSLTPGTCVQVSVEGLARNGLLVHFWNGMFRGAIEATNLGGTWIPTSKKDDDDGGWKSIFHPKQKDKIRKVFARILCVDATLKVIRLCMLPHVMTLSTPPPLPGVGTVVENATVVRLDHGVGALLALPPTDNAAAATSVRGPLSEVESYLEATRIRTAYVHISKALDDEERTSDAEFAKHFAPSSKHNCRILNTNHVLEGIATGATATSIVEAHVLTHCDLQPGKVYRNVPVHGHLEKNNSVLVDFGMGVTGLIPYPHLFDTNSQESSSFRSKVIKTKYAIGTKITVRVLTVNTDTKKCLVTAKKSLVNNKQTPVRNFESVSVGQVATGFVTKMDDKAMFVTFYNNVYGRVTLKRLVAEMGIQSIQENFGVGDVVTCRIVQCTNVHKKQTQHETGSYWQLELSLKLDGPMESVQPQDDEGFHLNAGAILPAKSLKIVELVHCQDRRGGGFIPGYAIVNIKSKHLASVENEIEDDKSFHVECKLPYDQLADSYSERDVSSAESLNALAQRLLAVGKKINQPGIVVLHPRKPRPDGKMPLPILSLRPKWIEEAEAQKQQFDSPTTSVMLPSRDTHLVLGQFVCGFVTRTDERYGAFVRFLDNLTGLVPKVKKGLELPLYATVTCKIIALDTTQRPFKILLKKSKPPRQKEEKKGCNKKEVQLPEIAQGDTIGTVQIKSLGFAHANLKLLDDKFVGLPARLIRARIHFTMAKSLGLQPPVPKKHKKKTRQEDEKASPWRITKHHPFYQWQVGMKLERFTCASVDTRNGVMYLELTNRRSSAKTEKQTEMDQEDVLCVDKASDLRPGQNVSGIVTYIPRNNLGVFVQLCPGVTGYIPTMELTTEVDVMNELRSYYPIGARVDGRVVERQPQDKVKAQKEHKSNDSERDARKKTDRDVAFLSVLHRQNPHNKAERAGDKFSGVSKVPKPGRGDLVVGRINRSIPMTNGPALMLDLRGGFIGRCCVTELEEVDEWINMPMGRMRRSQDPVKEIESKETDKQNIVTDEEDDGDDDTKEDSMNVEEDSGDDEESTSREESQSQYGQYPRGKYVKCRVLADIPTTACVEVSLRSSRIEGDLDDDKVPEEKEMVQAYVVDTNKKGCFVRLSGQIEGRVTLKEIADGFVPDPAAAFPMGRLVVGKVKAIRDTSGLKKRHKQAHPVRALVDLDMRESTLLESKDKLKLEDIKVGVKHKGIVTRIETYGVFVRLDNSNVSGLVHKSECSDDYIKNLSDLYDPGDLVKVLVVKADLEGRRIGLSMKASHFQDDEDSDDSSVGSTMDDDEDEDDFVLESDDEDVEVDEPELDSDYEEYASTLALKLASNEEDSEQDTDSDSSSDSEEDSSDEESDDGDVAAAEAMDTDVGFNWDAGVSPAVTGMCIGSDDDDDSASDEDSDEDEDEDSGRKSRKSRKKAAARRREEQEIARRETALADGTADENPETSGDFERLLASDPNRSEHWIRYMAYHLSMADVQKARSVAERAFSRIEFRQEGEKLNVWTAVLTLELKYGTPTTLQETIDRACQHNNPKQVYLRVCEILERNIDGATSDMASSDASVRADEMFAKMCKKFKSKKTVWISHLQYLLKSNRHSEAHALLKRSLISLPEYKHVETMSKFAQMEFEHGSAERGRTIFDGLLQKYPKRLDLLFVHVDKEVKNGEVDAARALFESVINSEKRKLSDKQMKSLFKKWYRVEEEHGTDVTREHVKDAAREYVERTSKE